MDVTRKWTRKQLATVLSFPLGTAMAALIVLLMIPDGRYFTVTGRWFALASAKRRWCESWSMRWP